MYILLRKGPIAHPLEIGGRSASRSALVVLHDGVEHPTHGINAHASEASLGEVGAAEREESKHGARNSLCVVGAGGQSAPRSPGMQRRAAPRGAP